MCGHCQCADTGSASHPVLFVQATNLGGILINRNSPIIFNDQKLVRRMGYDTSSGMLTFLASGIYKVTYSVNYNGANTDSQYVEYTLSFSDGQSIVFSPHIADLRLHTVSSLVNVHTPGTTMRLLNTTPTGIGTGEISISASSIQGQLTVCGI